MKARLEFNLPEDKEDFENAQNGTKYKDQLDEIWNKVFRPRHKFGYTNPTLNKFTKTLIGEKVMDELERLYREALDDKN